MGDAPPPVAPRRRTQSQEITNDAYGTSLPNMRSQMTLDAGSEEPPIPTARSTFARNPGLVSSEIPRSKSVSVLQMAGSGGEKLRRAGSSEATASSTLLGKLHVPGMESRDDGEGAGYESDEGNYTDRPSSPLADGQCACQAFLAVFWWVHACERTHAHICVIIPGHVGDAHLFSAPRDGTTCHGLTFVTRIGNSW